VTAVLSDKSFVKIVNGFAGGYPEPEIVVLANGKSFVETADLIEDVSTNKNGGRANATEGQAPAVDITTRLCVFLGLIDSPAISDPDLVGVA
jgi:hypothetical protein